MDLEKFFIIRRELYFHVTPVLNNTFVTGALIGQEDCLYMDIVIGGPDRTPQLKPVLVYINNENHYASGIWYVSLCSHIICMSNSQEHRHWKTSMSMPRLYSVICKKTIRHEC